MVVFSESPDASEKGEILNLYLCEVPSFDSRSVVELGVELDGGKLRHEERRLGSRDAVNEQLEIIHPHGPVAREQRSQEDRSSPLVKRQGDAILGPLGRAREVPALHVVELHGPTRPVLSQPEPGEPDNGLRSKPPAQFQCLPGERDRK